MIVWPGLRRSVSAVQRLFNSASFYAPLTHSLVLERGTGSPTFTRATTATGQKWDEAGYLDFTALAGEIVFKGSRRVWNLIATTSEDFSNAAWTKANTTVVVNQATAPNGTLTADLVYPTTPGTGIGRYVWQNPSVSGLSAGATLVESFYVKAAGKSWVCLGLPGAGVNEGTYFNVSTGVVGTIKAGALNPTIEDVGDGWYRCSLGHVDAGGSLAYPLINVVDGDNSLNVTTNGTDGVYIWGAQLEDVTGQTTQTASEYVSVGATPINLCLQSQTIATAPWVLGNGIAVTADQYVAPDGTTTVDKLTALAGNTQHFWYQTITTTAGVATYSVYLRYVNNQWARIGIYDGASGYYAAFDILNGVVGSTSGPITATAIEPMADGITWRVSITATIGASALSQVYLSVVDADDPSFGLWNAVGTEAIGAWGTQLQTGSTATTYIPTTTVAKAYNEYHGAGVDGVKCYDTDRSGNPISTTGSYPLVGYVPWEARTNLCLQSNAFTTTWLTLGSPTITQNVVGPDGATSAWTLTDATGADFSRIYQSITLTAATHTLSLFVKKAASVVTNCPLMLVAQGANIAAVTMDSYNGVATVWTTYSGPATVTSSARCSSYNDDYWRFELTFLATAAAWAVILHPAATSSPTQSTGVEYAAATGSAVFYGAMVNLGAFAGQYIPTTTVAVARNADVDQYPTTAGPIAAAGSIALDFTPYHAPSGTIALWGTYVDASNYTAILHDATNLIFRKRIAGSNYDATIANAFVSGTTYKIAATWGAAGTAIYLDGVAGTPHANTTAAQIAATMQVGADGNSLQQPGAGTTNLRIWQRQLSSPEGVAVTA